jgi:long-chain acyl-CoA synthetase
VSAPLEWLRRGDAARDALVGQDGARSAAQVADALERAAAWLGDRGIRVLATRADNGPDWAIADLAAWSAGVVHVPLPAFFTADQCAHVLDAAGVDAVASDSLADGAVWPGTALRLQRRVASPVPMPPGTVKLSFTSGSTGRPRGACLSGDALARVAEGVAAALGPIGVARHLSSLPLPVLLENVAGLYAPLAAGAAVVLAPLAEVGLHGSSRFDPMRLQAAVERWRADTAIVLPQMLRAWAAARAALGQHAAPAPRFVAVGGAAVGAATLAAARAAGLPAFEGYGLTECGSVQTLNLPGADRPGSAGRPLPHARISIAVDGEVRVSGTPMLGYLGDAPGAMPAEWPTGDLGHLDADGFLHLSGRRRNLLITAFGRNVSPEWVETALQSQPAIGSAVVLGDGRPVLSAVVWPSRPGLPPAAVQHAIDAANATLPDYARIGPWVLASAPLDAASGTATPNGRPLRDAIESLHRAALAAAYRRSTNDVLP